MTDRPGDLAIIGGGGHALVVREAAVAAGWRLAGFYDDSEDAPLAADADRLGDIASLRSASDLSTPAIIALGGLAARRVLIDRLDGAAWATIAHPSAIVSPSATIGQGTLVGPGVIVNPRAHVGAHAILNSGCVVEHDCAVGENVHIAPRGVLGGAAAIGDDTLVGIGATVLPMVRIGRRCVISGGGAAAHDIPDRTTAIGVPARETRRTKDG